MALCAMPHRSVIWVAFLLLLGRSEARVAKWGTRGAGPGGCEALGMESIASAGVCANALAQLGEVYGFQIALPNWSLQSNLIHTGCFLRSTSDDNWPPASNNGGIWNEAPSFTGPGLGNEWEICLLPAADVLSMCPDANEIQFYVPVVDKCLGSGQTNSQDRFYRGPVEVSGTTRDDACGAISARHRIIRNPTTVESYWVINKENSYYWQQGSSIHGQGHQIIDRRVFYVNPGSTDSGIFNIYYGWDFTLVAPGSQTFYIQPRQVSTWDMVDVNGDGQLPQGIPRQLCYDVQNGNTGNDIKNRDCDFTDYQVFGLKCYSSGPALPPPALPPFLPPPSSPSTEQPYDPILPPQPPSDDGGTTTITAHQPCGVAINFNIRSRADNSLCMRVVPDQDLVFPAENSLVSGARIEWTSDCDSYNTWFRWQAKLPDQGPNKIDGASVYFWSVETAPDPASGQPLCIGEHDSTSASWAVADPPHIRSCTNGVSPINTYQWYLFGSSDNSAGMIVGSRWGREVNSGSYTSCLITEGGASDAVSATPSAGARLVYGGDGSCVSDDHNNQYTMHCIESSPPPPSPPSNPATHISLAPSASDMCESEGYIGVTTAAECEQQVHSLHPESSVNPVEELTNNNGFPKGCFVSRSLDPIAHQKSNRTLTFLFTSPRSTTATTTSHGFTHPLPATETAPR